jgi:hypothetical protein
MDDSRSFINTMKSFPNIEVIQDFTYNASKPGSRRLRNNKHPNESVDDFVPEKKCNLDWPIRVWDGLRWIKLIMGVMN